MDINSTERKRELEQPVIRQGRRKSVAYIRTLIILVMALTVGMAYLGISLSAAQSHSQNLSARLSTAEKQLHTTQSDQSSQNAVIESQQDQMTEMQSSIHSLQNQLEEKDAVIQAMESMLSSLKSLIQAQSKGGLQSIVTPVEGRVCYLTFDDGPSPNTLKILDILKANDIQATFFVCKTGYMPYLKNIAEAGHAIGLHSATHNYSRIYKSTDNFFSDIETLNNAVMEQIGLQLKLMRFPGGSSNTISKKYSAGIMSKLTKEVSVRGYAYFDWNVSSGDADAALVPAAKIVKTIKSQTGSQEKVVVLMHDSAAKTTTVQALPEVIQFYRSKGYVFLPLGVNSPVVHHRVNN